MATIEDPTTFTKTVTFEGAFTLGGDQTIGDGTDAATLTLDADGAAAGLVKIKKDGVLRGQIGLDSSENMTLEIFANDGTTSQGTVTMATSTGVVTIGKGLTITDGTVTISETGALALSVAGLPLASTTIPLVRVGDTALVGGAAAGTFLGLNTDAATTADLVHFQNNDTTEFKVTSAGIATCAGGLTVSAGAVTITGCTVVGLHSYLNIRITNLVAADAKIYGMNCPVAGTITRIASSLEGAALAAGDATITAKIGATGVTDGVITITQSGSAVGDLDAVTPSAANTVAVGSRLNFTVGGANTDTAAFAELTITVLRSS